MVNTTNNLARCFNNSEHLFRKIKHFCKNFKTMCYNFTNNIITNHKKEPGASLRPTLPPLQNGQEKNLTQNM